jgi:hypothetical protein
MDYDGMASNSFFFCDQKFSVCCGTWVSLFYMFPNMKRIFNRKTFGAISPIIHWSFNWSLISNGTLFSDDEFSHNLLIMKLLFNIRFADFELWREHIKQRYSCSTTHRELFNAKYFCDQKFSSCCGTWVSLFFFCSLPTSKISRLLLSLD